MFGKLVKLLRSMLKKLSLIVIGISTTLYIGICLLLRWGQGKLIFVPHNSIHTTPQEFNLEYQDVWIDIDREKIHGWWIPSFEPKAPTILYFHGNGSNNADVVDIAAIFRQLGLSVLLIDYRGYGKSSQTFPNEQRVYEDAVAAWKYLTQERQIKPKNIIVYGHSLGGAIAIELATKYPEMAGLIIEGTFTSIKDVARQDKLFRVFPLDLILTQHFDSISKIDSLQVPLLILHGQADEIIPVSMAQKLFSTAPHPKQLVIIPDAKHNNLHHLGGQKYLESLQQFIYLTKYNNFSH